jgi:hypothetical protein
VEFKGQGRPKEDSPPRGAAKYTQLLSVGADI